MKSIATALIVTYGLYFLVSFGMTMTMADNLNQCNADVVLSIKNMAKIGRLGGISNACASTEAIGFIAR